ncbi:MAG TPA: Hsp20/alpha crystallin family protein [Allocoleopsis sp.]
MTLVRWNPWQEIDTLQRQLDRLFEDSFTPPAATLKNPLARIPAAELKETDEAILLKLELPGVDAKDLDVEVTEEMVSVKGERKSETQSENNGVIRSEFHYGTFQRMIPLPARVQNTQVKAEYKDGILHLTLPKTDAEKHKVVKVQLN